ncbi:protocadherin Fat 1-like isoform X2 [Branchiostoma floridae x Branchiostoma japonicum]
MEGNTGVLRICAIVFVTVLCRQAVCQRTPSPPGDFRFTRKEYNATIMENSQAKTYVKSRQKMGIYITSDLSASVKYSIVDGDPLQLFKAEQHLVGDFFFLRIRTKGGNTYVLNREVTDSYKLRVKAEVRKTNSRKLEFWVDVFLAVQDMNDLRPLFSPTSYYISVSEDTQIRSSIAQVTATDADIGTNGEFYYSFSQETDTFAIHPASGVVSLTRQLDYNQTPRYELTIIAEDRGLHPGGSGFSSTSRLQITVVQDNLHAPEILVRTLPMVVEHNAEPLTYAVITVSDKDSGRNGNIQGLEIIKGNEDGKFEIQTGGKQNEFAIKVLQTLDRETTPNGYNLTLRASDKGQPPKFSEKVLFVQLMDTNDHAPVFSQTRYEVTVSEFAPVNTPVVMVQATDPDTGRNAEIVYDIQRGNNKLRFGINSRTGLIYTKGELHREERASYELTVVATDRANPSNRKRNSAVVVINIEDANDHDPVFNDSKLSANINENEKAGTWVLEVSAYDLDAGENGYLTYSLANVNPVPFEIDHFNGWITTTKELDYEMMPQKYMLRVRASDWGSPYRRETEMTIPVKLQNMNDNTPQFEKVKCEGTLSRDAPIGQRVHTLSAIDDDPADYVRYEILSGNENGLFELNPTSGDLTLARKIGQFEPSFISLKVTATDGDNQASPVYLNMTVTNSMQGNDYINLQCQSTGVAQEHMRKVQQKSRINALEEDETMHFSDIHTVNLHAPEIDSGIPREIDIGEDSSVGTVLATVNARDSDTGYNGMVVYVIAEGNTDSCFTIGMQSGELSILSPLDRERTESYILNITATDLGKPSKGAWKRITINVMDANDNKPRFSQDKYEETVDENIDIGSTILQVYASDPDSGSAGAVRYSLLTGTEKFSINEKSGVIKTTAALDREEAAVHSLRIQARDQDESYPLSSVVTVTVTLQDLNDNAPKFIPENYKVKVREDLPKGAVILMLEAQDPDEGRGGEIRYSLQDGDEGKFDVDRLTGVIRLVGMLDFEDRQVYNITARAKDKGSPQLTSTCKIEVEVIDINENLYAPEFPSFVSNGTVYENEEVGTEVLRVVATDLDSGNDGKVVYSIRDGSGLGRFVIDDEGIIRTAEVLDRETESRYWLTVYAQDRAAVPLYNIIEVYIEVLDVNDNAPLTEFPIYYPSIDEGSGSGKSVIQVRASDPDEDGTQKLTFRITSGNPQGFFQINQNSGLITTTSRRLDREQQAEHILEISVSDNGSPPQVSTTHVVVTVADVNDNSPDFGTNTIRIRVPERPRTNEKGDIYRVVASDDDVGPNGDLAYSIKGGNEKGRFTIDPTNGMISTRKPLVDGQQYNLKIQAVDHGRPQRKSKVIVVIDVVPLPPETPLGPTLKSPEPEYNYKMIQEDWKVKEWITVVEAEDPDSPDLWYNIIGGNVGEKFTIADDGILKLAKKLDWEERNKYNLTVEVTDGHKSATKQILLSVIDLNDNRPQFAQKKYEVEIPEEAPIDTLVTRVTASDVDENSRLFYSIDSSTDPVSMQKFRINPRTGEIYTASPLDHETKDQHILTIMAKDQDVSVMRNFVRVVINVKDSNDHRPIFSAQEYTGGVYETAAYGTSVVQVVATDRDRGANSELTYTIETGNVGNVFSIDETLGIIMVSKQLDRSALSQYHLTVKVRDNGNPPLSSTVPIHIGVTISNNAPPKFDAKEYAIEVSENARLGSLIVMLGATSRSSVTYEIIGGNTDGSFDVNPNSGVITCKKQLDYERQTSYNLTVQATNMVSLSSTATVLVHIADENDNPPVFSQSEYIGSISEAATIGSVVLDVNNIPLVIAATDADNELNSLLVYEIIESAAQKYFSIDSNTGALRTIRTLDHEDIAEFRFTVQVSDTGNPPLKAENPANVTIKVLDVNDSPPTCTQDIYEATLLLPTYKDVAIVTVEAEDADTEANTQLSYVLTMGNEDKKFSINKDTGVITIVNTTGLFDRYELSVRVGDGKFHTSCIIRIEVKRTVMSGLRFTEESYFSEVTENSTEVKTVAIVTAVGNLLNEPLEYKILNPNNMFEVSPTSGVLRTLGIPFDREEKEKYEIVIEVRDKRSTPRVAHVVVFVTIADINDNAPVFVNLPYYSVVQVDAEPGTPVRTVTAVDKDAGKNSEIRYSLDSGAHKRFRINRKTGQIMVKQPLEKDDTNKEYHLLIIAEDKGNPPLSARIEVPVTVMNKAMPVFEKPFYAVSIPENIQLHTPVINIKAASPDGLKLIYSITDGDPFNQFNIDFDTGVINVVGSLDYETKQNFRLTVRATDSRSGVDAEVVVDITVQDINDVAPVFEKPSYEATLSEAAAIGTTVIKVSATDLDSGVNQLMYYQILQDEANSTDYFHIDTSSGLILTARNLDHEKIEKHDFTVRVSDGGMPSLSSEVHVIVTVLDLNDNAPQFDQPSYDCMISELAPRGHFVTKVSASDADSTDNNRLVYAIVSGNEQMNFVIDPKTGIVSMSNLRKRELDPTYTLNVSVSDGVFTSSARVAVVVQSANTHSPVFSQLNYAVSFDENNPRGTYVVMVTATDEDAGAYGEISYSIASEKINQLFEIDADTGQIYSKMALDREDENQRMIIVPVVASDQGGRVSFCNVTVTLTDKNDNTPQFELASYQANIPTDAEEGAEVIQVNAIDQDIGTNSDIAYSLYDDSDTTAAVVKLFSVHSETGMITTRQKLTGKEGKAFQFFVQATDGGNPTRTSSAPVEILILGPDDIPPYFDPTVQHLYFVSEEMPVDSEVATVVADTNDTVKYSIVEADGPNSNKDNTFRIDSENGVIYVNKELDTETTAWYSLKVQAETLSSPPLLAFADVSIQVKDANDNKPKFDSKPYKITLPENASVGTSVIQVHAFDPDQGANGEIVYGFASDSNADEMSDFFTIDSESGWVTTLVPLDREMMSSYAFGVTATDKGEPKQLKDTTLVHVTVADVNDSPPTFRSSTYNGQVREDALPGTIVITVSTRDADIGDNTIPTYYITGGDPQGQFNIERKTGKVYVNGPLDRETKQLYVLNITATDGAFTAMATVNIDVQDVNDNSPICEQSRYTASISEDITPQTFVMEVLARDPDQGIHSQITYSLDGVGADKFLLDKDTGVLMTGAPLDREETPVYTLGVTAKDGGGKSCYTELTINLIDVNDNPPKFEKQQYLVPVYENTAVNTLLTRVQATDPDMGLNRKVMYSFVDSANGQFQVDENSGIVSLAKALDREAQASFNLTIRATDEGAPRRSSTSYLIISVLDINDNPPEFEFAEYAKNVSESTPIGSQIINVYAVSKDVGPNAEITYEIISGNEHGKFEIGSYSGKITIVNTLDYEASQGYYLTVKASDGGMPTLSDITTVSINVTDVNDNAPEFSMPMYSASISEDAHTGDSVIQVMATDRDSPPNAQVTYTIVRGDSKGQFNIAPKLGIVTVSGALDREEIQAYSLTVRAKDSGASPRYMDVVVNVDVLDINDSPPQFSQANYSVFVQESKPIGTSILMFTVKDFDAPQNGPPYTFSIISGNQGNEFHIDRSGILRTSVVFQSDMRRKYNLQVRVADAGTPSLYGYTNVVVEVIEESMYPPVVTPHQISISSFRDDFPGGVIGKLHATDNDMYDKLTYSLVSNNKRLFGVNPNDGKIIAQPGLDVGEYILNISVSDGKFITAGEVSVTVKLVTDEMLRNSVTVRFANIQPEEFLSSYQKEFFRTLRRLLKVKNKNIIVVSMQPVDGNLDVLFCIETTTKGSQKEDYYKATALRRELNQTVMDIQQNVGLSVLQIISDSCSHNKCPVGACRDILNLDIHAIAAISTAKISFVSPRHMRDYECKCPGGLIGKDCNPCNSNPCPRYKMCLQDPKSIEGFECVCPDGTSPPNCNQLPFDDKGPMTFGGNSYIRYTLANSVDQMSTQLSLAILPRSPNGKIMYARGEYDYSILELINGYLQYRFNCGSGEGKVTMEFGGSEVTDGKWHYVEVSRNGAYAELKLDHKYIARGSAAGENKILNLDDNDIYFGAEVANRLRKKRAAVVSNGFLGCMDDMMLNGERLPRAGANSVATLRDMTDVDFNCNDGMETLGVCGSNPCMNGGSCAVVSPSNRYICNCLPRFSGDNCQIDTQPCNSNPCKNGARCKNLLNDFKCECQREWYGKRCEHSTSCNCFNGATCLDTPSGKTCSCPDNFTGEKCQEDVNECSRNPCQNGATCHNTEGSYFCNCTANTNGLHCENIIEMIMPKIESNSINIGLEEIIGIICCIIFLLLLVIIFVMVRRCRQRRKRNPHMSDIVATGGDPNGIMMTEKRDDYHRDAKMVHIDTNLDDYRPPLPARPISYTPSLCGNSLNNLSDGAMGAEVEPVFSSSTDMLAVRNKNPAIVCSVAPTLPPPPPSNSASDSDSIQKPAWEFECPNVVEGYVESKVNDADAVMNNIANDEMQVYRNEGGSMTDMVSLSSLPSESCDEDNMPGYHWDCSDWMPSSNLPNITEVPMCEMPDSSSSSNNHSLPHPHPHNLHYDPNVYSDGYQGDPSDYTDHEYVTQYPDDEYGAGESDFPPPPDENYLQYPDDYQDGFAPIQPPSNMPVPEGDHMYRPQHYHPNQYLPAHHLSDDQIPMTEQEDHDYVYPPSYQESMSQLPPGYDDYGNGSEYNADYEQSNIDDVSVSMYTTSNASVSDLSGADMDESEVALSDYESGGEGDNEGSQGNTRSMPQNDLHTEV